MEQSLRGRTVTVICGQSGIVSGINIDNRSLKTKIVEQHAIMPRALQIIYKELTTTMALCGEREISNVGRHNIVMPVQSHLTPKIKKRTSR